MNTSQTTLTASRRVRIPARAAGAERAHWGFVGALVLLFWVPEAILYMGWAKFWITLLAEVYIWALFAVAFNLLMGYTGMVSFGQAAYLGIGGYTAGLLLKKISGFPFALGLAAAPVAAALAALLIGYCCIRLTHTYFAMLTLAFSMIVYYIAFKWYDFTGGDNGLIGIPVPAWVQGTTFYKFVLVVTLISLYLLWRIVHSPFGKTLTAIRENPERAGFVGIHVKRYQLYAFVVAGAFSGLAGALFMLQDRSVYPELAFWTRSTQVLLMSILGGI
ncbi:MAG: branched-chain amino acid ABC transporter permease [candidate division KSB1 bacterium]|nr:branched-chain amino acid ABC transporter permease [candidate division KSB1 bacterium]